MSSNGGQTDVDGGVRRAALFAAYEGRRRVEPAPVKPFTVPTTSTSAGPRTLTTSAPAAPPIVAAPSTLAAAPLPAPADASPAPATRTAATTAAAPTNAAPTPGPSLVLNIGGPGGTEAAGTALAAHILRSIGADFAIPDLLAGAAAAPAAAKAGSTTTARPGSTTTGNAPSVSALPAFAATGDGGIAAPRSVASTTPAPPSPPPPPPVASARPSSIAQVPPVPVFKAPPDVSAPSASSPASNPAQSAPAQTLSKASVPLDAPVTKPTTAPVLPERPSAVVGSPPAGRASRAPLPAVPTSASASTPTTSPDTPTSSSTATASQAGSPAPARKPLPAVPQGTPARPVSVSGSGAASSSPTTRPLPMPPGASSTGPGTSSTGQGPSPTGRKLPDPPVAGASAEKTISPAPAAQTTSPPATKSALPSPGDMSFSLGTPSPATSPPKAASRSPKPSQDYTIPPVTYDEVVELARGAPVHTVTTDSGKPMFFFSAAEAFGLPPLDDPRQASTSAAGSAKPRAPSSDFTFGVGTPSSPPRVPASVPSDGKAVPTAGGVGASALPGTAGGLAKVTTPSTVKEASGVPKAAKAVGTAIAATAVATTTIAVTSSSTSASTATATTAPPPPPPPPATSPPTAKTAARPVVEATTSSRVNATSTTSSGRVPPPPAAPVPITVDAPTLAPPIDRWASDDKRLSARFHPPMRLLPRGHPLDSEDPEDYYDEWEYEADPRYGYPPSPSILLKTGSYFPSSSYSLLMRGRGRQTTATVPTPTLDPAARISTDTVTVDPPRKDVATADPRSKGTVKVDRSSKDTVTDGPTSNGVVNKTPPTKRAEKADAPQPSSFATPPFLNKALLLDSITDLPLDQLAQARSFPVVDDIFSKAGVYKNAYWTAPGVRTQDKLAHWRKDKAKSANGLGTNWRKLCKKHGALLEAWSKGQPKARWLRHVFEDADYSFEFVDGNIVSMVADDGDGVRGPLMSFDRRTLRMVTPTPVEYPKDLVWRTRWNTPIGPVILVNNRSGGVSTNEDKCWELWVTNSARDMFPRTPPLAGDKKSIESDEDEGPPGFTRLVKLPRPKDWGTYDVHITGEVVNTATGPKQEVNIHVVEEFNEGVSTVARAQEVASSAPRQEHLHPRKVVKIVYGRDHQSLFDGSLKLDDKLFIQAVKDEIAVYERHSGVLLVRTSSSAILQSYSAWVVYNAELAGELGPWNTTADGIGSTTFAGAEAAGGVLDVEAKGYRPDDKAENEALGVSLIRREKVGTTDVSHLNQCHIVGDCLVMFRPSGVLVIVQDYKSTLLNLKGKSEVNKKRLLGKKTMVIGLATGTEFEFPLAFKFASFEHRFAVSSGDRILLFDTTRLPKSEPTVPLPPWSINEYADYKDGADIPKVPDAPPLPFRAIVDLGEPDLYRTLSNALAIGTRMFPICGAEDIFMDDRALYVRCELAKRHRVAYEGARKDDPEMVPWREEWSSGRAKAIGVRVYQFAPDQAAV